MMWMKETRFVLERGSERASERERRLLNSISPLSLSPPSHFDEDNGDTGEKAEGGGMRGSREDVTSSFPVPCHRAMMPRSRVHGNARPRHGVFSKRSHLNVEVTQQSVDHGCFLIWRMDHLAPNMLDRPVRPFLLCRPPPPRRGHSSLILFPPPPIPGPNPEHTHTQHDDGEGSERHGGLPPDVVGN